MVGFVTRKRQRIAAPAPPRLVGPEEEGFRYMDLRGQETGADVGVGYTTSFEVGDEKGRVLDFFLGGGGWIGQRRRRIERATCA